MYVSVNYCTVKRYHKREYDINTARGIYLVLPEALHSYISSCCPDLTPHLRPSDNSARISLLNKQRWSGWWPHGTSCGRLCRAFDPHRQRVDSIMDGLMESFKDVSWCDDTACRASRPCWWLAGIEVHHHKLCQDLARWSSITSEPPAMVAQWDLWPAESWGETNSNS